MPRVRTPRRRRAARAQGAERWPVPDRSRGGCRPHCSVVAARRRDHSGERREYLVEQRGEFDSLPRAGGRRRRTDDTCQRVRTSRCRRGSMHAIHRLLRQGPNASLPSRSRLLRAVSSEPRRSCSITVASARSSSRRTRLLQPAVHASCSPPAISNGSPPALAASGHDAARTEKSNTTARMAATAHITSGHNHAGGAALLSPFTHRGVAILLASCATHRRLHRSDDVVRPHIRNSPIRVRRQTVRAQ